MFPVICFLAGISMGVIIMCLLQIGKTPKTPPARWGQTPSEPMPTGPEVLHEPPSILAGKVAAPRPWPTRTVRDEVER